MYFKNIKVSIKNIFLSILGAFIQAFGIYNIHSISLISEGGLLGIELLLKHWFEISPALSGFLMSTVCYLVGLKILGKTFLFYSAISSSSYSLFYFILENFPRLYPQISNMPFTAAVLGAIFVGVGAGICVKAGGATSGDDALAMIISNRFNIKIQWVYLFFDIFILALSLTYISFNIIIYSILTVIISGQIVGFINDIPDKI